MNERTATGAQPMPANGQRALSGAEAQRRAKAMAMSEVAPKMATRRAVKVMSGPPPGDCRR